MPIVSVNHQNQRPKDILFQQLQQQHETLPPYRIQLINQIL